MAFHTPKNPTYSDYKAAVSIGGQRCLCCKEYQGEGKEIGVKKGKVSLFILCQLCIDEWKNKGGSMMFLTRFKKCCYGQ